jgi:hypothetical protein
MDPVKHLTPVALDLIITGRNRIVADLRDIEAGQLNGLTQSDIDTLRARLSKLNDIIRNHSASVH